MKKIFARIAAPLKKNPGVVWTVIGVCLPPPTNVEEPFLHSAWPSAASRADHPHLRAPGGVGVTLSPPRRAAMMRASPEPHAGHAARSGQPEPARPEFRMYR